jgi:hypothetical protein
VTVALSLDRAEAIPGWMDRDELEWLAEQAAQASTIVEVGCWCGRSTRAMADATAGKIWCVDPWTGTQEPVTVQTRKGDLLSLHKVIKLKVFAAFVENMAAELTTGRVQVLPTRSLFAVHILRHLAPFDFVFLDGDHAYASVAGEIEAFRPLVRAGGVLAGHDYGNDKWPQVSRAVDALVPDRQVLNRIWWTRV